MMQSGLWLTALCGAIVGISACVDSSSLTPHEPMLVCQKLSHNARGDIDPVPSPDGKYVAYRRMTAASPELGELHYLRLDNPSKSHILLSGGEFHGGASWSPDSNWLSYTRFERIEPDSALVANSVYKINIYTKENVLLVDGSAISGIGEYTSWTSGNEIYFATPTEFYAVSAQGGAPKWSFPLGMELPHAPRQMAADSSGKFIAFSVDLTESDNAVTGLRSGIWLADLKARQVVQLTRESRDSFPIWRNAGTLLFLRENHEHGVSTLNSLALSTGKVAPIGNNGILQSIAKTPDQNALFAATADRWNLEGNDLNFFREFSIAKCKVMPSHQ